MATTRKRAIQEATDTKNSRKKIKLRNPRGVDYLSGLSNHCLRDVFERIDLNDLDEISTLNNRLEALSKSARSRAMKVKACELVITEVVRYYMESPALFWISIDYGHSISYSLNVSPTTKSVLLKAEKCGNIQRKVHPILPQQEMDFEIIVHRILTVVDRFDFESCKFKSICFDKNSIKLLEFITCLPSLSSLRVDDCFFDETSTMNIKERFLSMLLCAKIETVSLRFRGRGTNLVPQQFLIDYSQVFHLPNLSFTDPYLRNREFRPEIDLMEYLPNFGTFEMPRMLINTYSAHDWVIPPLLRRLQQKKIGQWFFHTGRHIQFNDFQQYLEPDLKISNLTNDRYRTNIYSIEIEGTDHKVEVKSWHYGYNACVFRAFFS
ncbi:hypothetical protein PMAYCL1PPCAC_28378 [Pristionchus mayeri]|uniref:F-box domain-containing protein n=1 Tax=Pristionchus mayeri TaxID=1317129 RepID=A0AAN5I9Y6_9BILA|nr:hypothetical protein PMAYCL1PPCAC_28378 [Pristionchus mayeri]